MTAVVAALVLGVATATMQPAQPEVQRPTGVKSPEEPAPQTPPAETPAPDDVAAQPEAPTGPDTSTDPNPDLPGPASAAPVDAPAEPPVTQAPPPAVTDTPVAATPKTARPDDGEIFTVAEGAGPGKPPYYDAADEAALRKRYELEAPSDAAPRTAKWRCIIADTTCGTSFELNATAAYAYRTRQGDVRRQDELRWHSGRAQYDFWLNLPVMVETLGKQRFTRMTMGPKGGVIFSDSGTLWGNLGIAARYWLGRGRFAPTIEFSGALSYRLGGRPTGDLRGEDAKFKMVRGPVGFTGDVGVGLGGFGAIILGGQYDSPLAREDVPERFRVSAGGMFFVGFRGNIAWGAPAAAAVATHGLTQRYANEP